MGGGGGSSAPITRITLLEVILCELRHFFSVRLFFVLLFFCQSGLNILEAIISLRYRTTIIVTS